ncbi:MAG: hypothetical protein M3Q07_07625 [Pseudobdellovibrionaceae bacterium]|nr:hypothetical protein [Pseudobdellovibrionaceae bacterium]
MSRQSPLGAIQFVLISSLVSFACSRPMTCALEGCNQDNGVVLSSDLNAGQSADATAQQDTLGKKIKDIFDRLGATEALTALLQETVRLHETRHKTIEDHAQGVDGELMDIQSQLEHHEEHIHSQEMALQALRVSMDAKIAAQAAIDKAAIDGLRTDLDSTEADLVEAIADLDTETQESIKGILNDMKIERARVDNADIAVAQTAQDKLDALQTALNTKIGNLEKEDTSIRAALAKEIGSLDGRVNDVIKSTNKEFGKLWTSYGLLQAQLILVAADNIIDRAKIRKEIDDVEALLAKEIKNRGDADQKIWDDIVIMKANQAQTQADLDILEKAYGDFVAAQKLTNQSVDSQLTAITTRIDGLKTTLEAQIATESERVNHIMNVLVPSVSGMITDLQTKSANLQISLDGLKTSVSTLDSSLNSKIGEFNTLKAAHETLRSEFNTFSGNTATKLATLTTALANVKSCSVSIKTQANLADGGNGNNGNGNGGGGGGTNSQYAELTCGTTIVNLEIK